MTKQDSAVLKDRVRTAIKQQKRLETLEEQIKEVSALLTETLEQIVGTVLKTREPILVRFGTKIFQVILSPTTNPVAPVEIREAKLVA